MLFPAGSGLHRFQYSRGKVPQKQTPGQALWEKFQGIGGPSASILEPAWLGHLHIGSRPTHLLMVSAFLGVVGVARDGPSRAMDIP